MEPNQNIPENNLDTETLLGRAHANRHITAIVVIATLVIVAGIIGWSIWSILKTGGGDETPIITETDAEKEKRLADERQASLITQQSAEMEQIREERGLKPPTAEEIKAQSQAMEKIRTEKNIKPPTQSEIDQQSKEMEALRASMGQ